LEAADRVAHLSKMHCRTDVRVVAIHGFRDVATPAAVLALLDDLDAAEAKLAVVNKFLAEREQCLTAIKNCPPDRVDYWRWQGHAEARRVLADDLGKDRVAQADDPDRGRDS